MKSERSPWEEREKLVPAPRIIVPMSPLGYPSKFLLRLAK